MNPTLLRRLLLSSIALAAAGCSSTPPSTPPQTPSATAVATVVLPAAPLRQAAPMTVATGGFSPYTPGATGSVRADGATDKAPAGMRKWTFMVSIVSGSRAGQLYPGWFTVASSSIPAGGTGTVTATSFEFDYEGLSLSQGQFDSPVQIRFERGEPVDIIVTGGPQTQRFGFSAGFERSQFGRSSESFINDGHPYFGYLDSATFVDGAGVVTYKTVR